MAFKCARLKNDFGDPAGEARACREGCAVFDFSFLECARLNGPGARAAVEVYARRPLNKLARGAIAYAVRTDSSAVAVADLTVWRTDTDAYEVMSGRREDVTALTACASKQVEVENVGESRAVFDRQGLGMPNVLSPSSWKRQFDHQPPVVSFCASGTRRYRLCDGTVGLHRGSWLRNYPAALPRATRLGRTVPTCKTRRISVAHMLRIEAGFVLFDNEFRCACFARRGRARPISCGAKHARNPIKLVSFRAEAGHLSLPWVAETAPERPTQPGVIYSHLPRATA